MSSLFSKLCGRIVRLMKAPEPRRQPGKTDSFALLKRLNIPIASIIDVGVYEATQELIMAFPDMPHILCEPIDDFFPQIRGNYLGQVSSFLIVPHAIGIQNTTITLETFSVVADQDITHARMGIKGGDNVKGTRDVEMKTLDTVMSDLDMPRPHLLKIDIDGPDMDVILGAEQTLKHCSVICIEAGVKDLHQRLSVIRKYGFELFDLVDICYYEDRLIQMDAIFIRSDLIKSLGLEFYKDGFDIKQWKTFL
ncbi:MAG: FkbM family methyltransferase [Litorimonas sp.]